MTKLDPAGAQIAASHTPEGCGANETSVHSIEIFVRCFPSSKRQTALLTRLASFKVCQSVPKTPRVQIGDLAWGLLVTDSVMNRVNRISDTRLNRTPAQQIRET